MIITTPSNKKCSHCDQPLHAPAHIVWHMAALSLYLHIECAKTLAYQLRRNALKYENHDPFTIA